MSVRRCHSFSFTNEWRYQYVPPPLAELPSGELRPARSGPAQRRVRRSRPARSASSARQKHCAPAASTPRSPRRADAKGLALGAIPGGRRGPQRAVANLTELGIRRARSSSGPLRLRARQARAARPRDAGTGDAQARRGPGLLVGSAHAITDDGVVLVGSGSGSQLGAIAYAAGTSSSSSATRSSSRIPRRACAACASTPPARVPGACRAAGYPGSLLAKTLLVEQEPGGRISVSWSPRRSGSDPRPCLTAWTQELLRVHSGATGVLGFITTVQLKRSS